MVAKVLIFTKNKLPEMFEEVFSTEDDMTLNKDKEMQRIFKLTGYHLRTFRSLSSEDNSFLRLRSLIIEHQKTLRFVENLNEAIKYAVLFEFVMGSLSLASVTFQLITVSEYTKLIFAGILFCFQIIQIFIFAITANEIQVQSVAVATNAYMSPWYNENKKIRQMIAMIILRAQKPAVITIGPFKPMTPETAIMVMKSAYSYVAVMKESLVKK
ncbi:odorant receptor 49b-like [Sitophilus oryzae]|uniref:Odorant receptor 49b-like n=1 Tax=Sitophilus oryzae TaxID=7048 RepID=A0A6J2YWZ3_SITOR|nr:odorant receptor 49b-like [Sitophilus oryzae]